MKITETSLKECFLIEPDIFEDERGFLTILEKEIDFSIKRIFWIW